MNKTLSKVIASAMVAVTLMTAAPVTASAANANTTSSTSASASASTSTYKTMYAIKSVYSYKKVNGKLVKSTAVYKGTALKVKSSTSKYYILSDGRYINKTAVGAKRINWTDIKYSKPLTRYISKDNTKARAGALTSSKVSTTLDKGTQVTIVARTTSGFYKLDDGSYILQTSTTKTKPASTQGTTTTNSQYPNDKYGPGENGYDNIVLPDDAFDHDSSWNFIDVGGYVFYNCDGVAPKAIRQESERKIITEDKTEGLFADGTAVAGKDIPYGWYSIVSTGLFGDGCKFTAAPYITIKQNGKIIERIVPANVEHTFEGLMLYIPKGATVEADDLVIAPAPNGVFTGKTAKNISVMSSYEENATVQSILVSNDGYGIKPGTYKVTADNLADLKMGQYVYVIHDYFTQHRHNSEKCGCLMATFENLTDHGEFVWWTREGAEYNDYVNSPVAPMFLTTIIDQYECGGKEYTIPNRVDKWDYLDAIDDITKDNQPKYIELKAGDLVVTMAAKIELK